VPALVRKNFSPKGLDISFAFFEDGCAASGALPVTGQLHGPENAPVRPDLIDSDCLESVILVTSCDSFLGGRLMAFCATCGTAIPDGASSCPKCATAGTVATATAPSTAGSLENNVAGMLAYVTIIPAIVFLVMAPFNQRPFVRFHAFQSIFFNVAWIILWVALSIIGSIPVLGWMTFLIWPLVGIGGLIIWVILLLKAYQNQMWQLPVIGPLAAKQAGNA